MFCVDQIFSKLVVDLLKLLILAGAILLLGTTKSKAVLQANSTTHKSPVTKYGVQWITQIRQMETSGQTMGLTETLDGLNATSASNGIDVHMMLPTEYGAVAILSASGYGNSGKLRDTADAQKRTTTGNSTGVYFMGDMWELSASYGGTPYGLNNYTNSVGGIWIFAKNRGWHEGSFTSNATDAHGCTVSLIETGDCLVVGGKGLLSVGCLANERGSGAYWNGYKNYKPTSPSRGVAANVL